MLDRLYHQLQVRIIFCGKENVYGLDEDSFVAIIIGQHMRSVELTNMVWLDVLLIVFLPEEN